MTIPSVKKLAIKDAVEKGLERYGRQPAHRFGISDDDPDNIVLAISAMRDCKEAHPDKRFFVINTNALEFVKLEVFPMMDPVTATAKGRSVLADEEPIATDGTILHALGLDPRKLKGVRMEGTQVLVK